MHSLDTTDFNSEATVVTFNPGDMNKSVNIVVYRDDLVESNELFNIVLSLSPHLNLRIKVDDKNSVAEIEDSTGKSSMYSVMYNLYCVDVRFILLIFVVL